MSSNPYDNVTGFALGAPGAPPRVKPKPKPEDPYDRIRKKSSDLPGRENDPSSCTVQFELQQASPNLDVCWQYFESPSSGGGGVEAVTTHQQKRIVQITFSTPEAAQRVAGREHTVNGETVTVEMCVPPRSRPKYPDLLMFHNVPEDLPQSTLKLFLEVVSKAKPLVVLYGDEPGVIVVNFDRQPDYVTVQKECQERLLEDRVRLSVSQVPMSGSILVEDLSPLTTEDTVMLHFDFESPQNNGGIVKAVVMFEDGSNRCIVDFQDLAVVQNVLKKPHTIDNQQVRVRVYLECLGQSGGTADPSIILLPFPIILEDTKKYETILIRDCPVVAEDFSKRLDTVHAKLVLSEEGMTFECTINSSTPKPRETAKSWSDNVQTIVSEFLDQITVFYLRINRHVWSEVAEELCSDRVPVESRTVFKLEPKDENCFVAGMTEHAYKLYQLISNIVWTVQQKANRKGQSVTETYSKLKPFELRLLRARSFDEEMMTRYEDLDVNIDVQKQLVTIHGVPRDVTKVMSEIDTLVKSIKCKKLRKLSDCQNEALNTQDCARFIEIQFTSSDVTATWEKGKKNDIHVYAFSDADCREAARIMLEAVFEDERQDTNDFQQTDATGLCDFTAGGSDTHEEVIVPVNGGQRTSGNDTAVTSNSVPAGTGQTDSNTSGASATTKPNNQPVMSSFCVYILEGEIAKETADVIVNTTSPDLKLTRGAVSWSILKEAGSSLQTELLSKYPGGVGKWEMARTGGHGMACVEVFHLVLDVWSREASQSLGRMIRVCLMEASSSNYTSIAFPALGTGRLEYPREEVARTMFSVVDQFQRDMPTTSLREVRIIVYRQDTRTVQIFRQVEQRLGTRQNGQVPAQLLQPATAPTTASSPPVGPRVKVSVIDGQLASQQVDVIVNTTSPDLDLIKEDASFSILRVAGPSLQDELRYKYPSGILPGQIAFTKGHRLRCKEIYHLALGPWRTNTEEVLSSLLFICAENASEKKYTSIAFPAFGTGELGYPCQQVAQTMFCVLGSLAEVLPSTTLREVRIVIHQDQQTLQVFHDAESQSKGAAAARVTSPTTRDLSVYPPVLKHREFRTSRVVRSAAENVIKGRFGIRGLAVDIVKGELTDQDVDLIVVIVNGQLQISDENVRAVLRRKSGNQIQKDLQMKAPELKTKGLALTSAYDLKCARVLFLNTDRFGHDLERSIFKCLKKSDILMIRTMAMPAVGAGVDNAHLSSKALYKALTKFSVDRQHVQVIRVVTHDPLTCRIYVHKIQDKLDKKNDAPKGGSHPEPHPVPAVHGEMNSAAETEHRHTERANPLARH